MDLSRDNLLKSYRELCATRDAVNAKNEPLERQLDAANARAAAAKQEADAIAAQIDANRGGQKWLDLKYQIAVLARALGRVPRETEAS